jgi:DNA-binding HxlR family transcriptional regulator
VTSTGQFCAVARALDHLGGRWTLLVVRELLSGSRRFNDIRRGIPRISRTILSERLQALTAAGAVERITGRSGPEYRLTSAGEELAELIGGLASWGQRWLPRNALAETLDLEPILVDMTRRVRFDSLPPGPLIVRLEFGGHRPSYLLLRRTEASLCDHNPGYPEEVILGGRLGALAAWWRGDVEFAEARAMGLRLEGKRDLVKAFPGWFLRYAFAGVKPAADRPSGRRMRSASMAP